MCGIFGVINSTISLNKIKAHLIHRGPDAQTTWEDNKVQLHHFRLSILDLVGGVQPMTRGDYVAIFNGELYNHKDVRKKFNLQCNTNSDTETLLAAFEKLGVACFNEFDGMMALAIYNRRTKKLFLARDRAGKKPLYIYKNNQTIAFSSELNALRAVFPLEVSEKHIANYMRLGSMYRTETPYKDTIELLGGHWASIDVETNDFKVEEWWNITDYYGKSEQDDYNTAYAKVDQYLREAVHRRIDSSDLEVGSFLSGGIDSGLVTALASEYTKDLKTFTVSFGGAYDEAPLAKLVAEKYKTKHHEIQISFDNLLNDVEKIISNYGEPFFDSSAIPSYYVSQEAKKYITVVLNGDGADELFGGYRRYVPFAHMDFFKTPTALKKILGGTSKILPLPKEKKSKYNYIYRLLDLASKTGIDSYFSSTTDIFEGYQNELLQPSFEDEYILEEFSKIIQDKELSGLNKIMNLDFNTILFSDLLVKMDIATMAHSLEGRSPFMTKELLEYAPAIQDEYKIKGKTTKYILRDLAKKYLPDTLVSQPKRGFEIPLKQWVENDLRDMIFDYLAPSSFCSNFVNPKFIVDLKDDRAKVPREKRAKMLWTLFALEVWYNKVYNNA